MMQTDAQIENVPWTVTSEYIWPVYLNRVKLHEEEDFKMQTMAKYKKRSEKKDCKDT